VPAGERLKKKLPDTLWSGDTVISSLTAVQRRQLVEVLESVIEANRDPNS